MVGWAIAEHLRTGLIVEALSMARGTRGPPAGVIFHSDYAAPCVKPKIVSRPALVGLSDYSSA